MANLFEGARLNKRYVLKSCVLALLFWLLQFFYQTESFSVALVRSFALAGATLISLALIIGPLARLTKYNFLKHRRTLGVWGFTFVLMHFLAAFYFYFSFQLPLDITVILFGMASMVLFIPAYLTSTDWAVQKLGFRFWKGIHRLVYIAYIFYVLHYTMAINTNFNYPRILLLALTIISILLEISAFFKTIARTKDRKDTLIGLLIILFGLVLFYAAYIGMFK